MAKRKNPLKDLDAFLKQQATSLVNPEKVSAGKEEPQGQTNVATENPKENPTATKEDILAGLHTLASKEGEDFRSSFYNIIRETLENLDHSSAADKMLINTVLYLDDRSNWKDNIQTYWKNR